MKITKGQYNLLNKAQTTAQMHARDLRTAQHIANQSAEHLNDVISSIATDAAIPEGTKFNGFILKATPEGEYTLELQAEVTELTDMRDNTAGSKVAQTASN